VIEWRTANPTVPPSRSTLSIAHPPGRIARALPPLALLAPLLTGAGAAHALEYLGKPLPAWAGVPPRGAVPLTEASVVGSWQEDLQPGMREPNGRASFPGMTWAFRADHTVSVYGSCRNGKLYFMLDAQWQLDDHRFLKLEAVRADGAHRPLGTMPSWMVGGKFAIPPNQPGERSTLEHYDGPLPPVCPV
jgi:hypothetical protein